MITPERQQLDLLFKRSLAIEGGAFQNRGDFTQRKFQRAEEQNLLEPLELLVAVQPVAGLRPDGGGEQADFVVILQCAYAYACQAADLADGHHSFPSPFTIS